MGDTVEEERGRMNNWGDNVHGSAIIQAVNLRRKMRFER